MKLARCGLLLLGVLLMAGGAMGREATAKFDSLKKNFEKKTFELKSDDGTVIGTMPYRIYLPEELRQPIAAQEDVANFQEKFPLIVFLHGAGERGNDNEKQLVWPEYLRFVSDEAPQSAILIAPQCPDRQSWSAIRGVMNDEDPTPTPPMQCLMALLDELDRTLPIQENQRYVTGMSMGGFGSFTACAMRPNYFAAAIPICGGMADPDFVKEYKPTAFWVFHGGADTAVPPERSYDAVRLLEKNGVTVRFTGYPGVGHNSWSAAYAEPEIVDWLFAQKLNQHTTVPKVVLPDEEPVTVEGVVTQNGTPVANATVSFTPADGKASVTASTDEKGRYTVKTSNSEAQIAVSEKTGNAVVMPVPTAEQLAAAAVASRERAVTLDAARKASIPKTFTMKEIGDNGSETDVSMAYRIFVPDAIRERFLKGENLSKEATRYPLVLFLHGIGERGDDNLRQIAPLSGDYIRFFTEAKENGAAEGAILVAAQCPADRFWGGMPKWGPNPPKDAIALLNGMLDELEATLPIEQNRRYVTGLSMGGFGTYALCGNRPGYFAAAVPICGGMLDPTYVKNYSGVTFHIFQGGDDPLVKPSFGHDAFKAIGEAGISVLYTEYPGVGHNSWIPAYRELGLVKWLFEQRREPTSR